VTSGFIITSFYTFRRNIQWPLYTAMLIQYGRLFLSWDKSWLYPWYWFYHIALSYRKCNIENSVMTGRVEGLEVVVGQQHHNMDCRLVENQIVARYKGHRVLKFCYYSLFTPPTRTRQNCLALSCPCRQCEQAITHPCSLPSQSDDDVMTWQNDGRGLSIQGTEAAGYI